MPWAVMITLVDNTVPVAADFNSNYSNIVNATIPATFGGTGRTSVTSGAVLVGQGTAAMTVTNTALSNSLLAGTTTAGVPVFLTGPTVETLTLSGTTTGTPLANTLYAPTVIKAWANINALGTVAASFNIATSTRTSTGSYSVTWDRDFTSGNIAVLISPGNGTATFGVISGSNVTGATMLIHNAAGSLLDAPFSILALGVQ